jgi:mannose-6-phosphate isomerase-like protein (cupin superfamily)
VTKRIVLAALVSAAAVAMAAEPTGVVVWPASELKGYAQKLAPKMNEKKLATQPLGRFGNHLASIGHREGDGEAELHETQADFFVVQSGNATLVVGGDVVDGKTTAPGEIRGPSIKNGQRHSLAVGDIVHIPAKVPHQLLVAPGKEFTYYVIKVDTP